MAIRTISDAGGLWSAGTTWVEGSAPTNSSDVVATATSGNVTISANVVCNSINLTGYVGTLTSNSNRLLTIGSGSNGDMIFSAGMTYVSNSGSKIVFVGTQNCNITTAGKTINAVAFNGSGTYTLMDNLTVNDVAVAGFSITKGTFNANGFNVTANNYNILTAGNTAVMNMGSGTWTVSNTATGSGWETQGSALTVNYQTSTVNILANNNSGVSIISSGFGLYNLTLNGSLTTSGVTFVDSFTIHNNLLFNGANSVTFNPSIVVTIIGNFSTTNLDASNTLIIQTGGSQFSFTKASGIVSVDFLDLSESNATGGASWYAGLNSIDDGGNSGWIFTAPPPSGGGQGQGSLILMSCGS